jgi:AcrR family transcriptional regulator
MTASQLKRRAIGAEDKTERRAAIVRAAAELVRRDPSCSCSVDQLAARAGVAKGTVYLYFGSREEVLLAVLLYVKAHPQFYPLAAGCRGMLDTNVSTEAALAFKLGIGKRLQGLGARIEQLYPGLKAGEGAALLMNCYALIIGLWQQADPPLSLRAVMDRPEMRIFRIDFEKQLNAALLDLWEAAARRVK